MWDQAAVVIKKKKYSKISNKVIAKVERERERERERRVKAQKK